MRRENLRILEKNSESVSEILRTLAHPTRLMILCTLAESPSSVGLLVESLGISQSLTSQFLIRMREEGLLQSKRQGKSIVYSIKDDRILRLLTSLRSIYCS